MMFFKEIPLTAPTTEVSVRYFYLLLYHLHGWILCYLSDIHSGPNISVITAPMHLHFVPNFWVWGVHLCQWSQKISGWCDGGSGCPGSTVMLHVSPSTPTIAPDFEFTFSMSSYGQVCEKEKGCVLHIVTNG